MSPEQLHHSRIRPAVDGIRQKPLFDIADATIAVIGLDPDGFSLAQLAASHDLETIGFDTDDVKVAQLEALNAEEPQRNLSITSDPSALARADVLILCATLPLKDGTPDLGPLEAAASIAAQHLKEGSLVIVGTVVLPGVCEHVVLPILERASGLVRPAPEAMRGDFYFAHAPVSRGKNAVHVVGAANAESLSRALAFYRALSGDCIAMRSVKEAEAVPLVEDSLRDSALALTAEFALVFDRIGIDIVNVMRAIRPEALDIASLSGIHVPNTQPSAYYLARSGHEHEIERPFLNFARRIIEHMPLYAVSTLADALRERRKNLKGATIALLGLSDADGIADNSVGERIRGTLVKKGASVNVFDPYIATAGEDLKRTLSGADAAVIASDHPVFCNMTPSQFEELGVPIVVDACNCLDKEAFEKSAVTYRGIGRG